MTETNKDITCKVVRELAVISTDDYGYTKELNLVSWNEGVPKYDIRRWSPGKARCGKGITLTRDEIVGLKKILNEVLSDCEEE